MIYGPDSIMIINKRLYFVLSPQPLPDNVFQCVLQNHCDEESCGGGYIIKHMNVCVL